MLPRALLVIAWIVVSATTVVAQGIGSKAKEYFRAGYMASMAREWDSAVSLFTKAVELDPVNPEVYLQRAACFQMADRIDEAIADYEKTLALKPDYYLALEYLAKLYEIKGEYEKAVNLYARALPLVSDSKWRSVVKWWMSQAQSRIQPARHKDDNAVERVRRSRTNDSRR
ncbi:MAG: tetratricopeptide repeat protein [Deltaproteobacteria bacterium]|nr:tetratricopeptide repeat protein [Deltaproteobacteria bacterium]